MPLAAMNRHAQAIERIKAAAIDGRHSAAWKWLYVHYDSLSPSLGSAADWREVARIIIGLGLRDARGGTVTVINVRCYG
jgi:hypothetical protein